MTTLSNPGPTTRVAAAPWIERVPPLALVTFAATLLVSCTVAFALLAARHHGTAGWLGPVIGAAATAGVLLVPSRLGPALSLAGVASFLVLEATTGALSSSRSSALPAVTAIVLTGAILAGAYLRLGLRRREAELELAREVIGELTRRDRITELLSGRRELTWLQIELARSRRHHHQFALVVMRADGLEALGDGEDRPRLEVLEAVAEVVGNELRTTDVALRLDSETFALILPETSTAGARLAAERVRLLLPQRFAADSRVSVSSGIATFPRDADNDAELVVVAQQALERAVELGGNRTLCASVDDAPAGWTLAGAGATT